MGASDPLKDAINSNTGRESNNTIQAQNRAHRVMTTVKRRQSQGDALEFGLIKLWSILLQFFTQLHVSTQKQKINKNITFKTNNGDQK